MVPKSLPPRTHAFFATDGRLLRVAEREDGHHIEGNSGSLGLCRYTGPEILKLSEQGRALWGALWYLLDTVDRRALNPPEKLALDLAKSVLDQTAATFDHNEPEERPRGGLEEPEPDSHPAPQSFTPKFGERLRGIHASEANPQRDGLYVRTIRRLGKLNPGVWYELTDGLGNFWEYPALSVTRVTEGGA